jgi:hypothetical protein
MNASSSSLSTIIPIYVLALGGQVREVAIALFLSNLTVTLGAVFRGRLIDAMHWRKTIIAICSAAIAITCASMYFVPSIPILMLMSALVGFFSVGPAPGDEPACHRKVKEGGLAQDLQLDVAYQLGRPCHSNGYRLPVANAVQRAVICGHMLCNSDFVACAYNDVCQGPAGDAGAQGNSNVAMLLQHLSTG